jgi:hypothetical protein
LQAPDHQLELLHFCVPSALDFACSLFAHCVIAVGACPSCKVDPKTSCAAISGRLHGSQAVVLPLPLVLLQLRGPLLSLPCAILCGGECSLQLLDLLLEPVLLPCVLAVPKEI